MTGLRLYPLACASGTIGYYSVFRRAIPVSMVDTYVLLTRSPLIIHLAQENPNCFAIRKIHIVNIQGLTFKINTASFVENIKHYSQQNSLVQDI